MTWILTFILIKNIGYQGVAIASFLVSISSIFVIFVSKRYLHFSIIRPIMPQIIASLTMMLFIMITRDNLVQNIYYFFIEICLSGIVYLGMLFLLAKTEITSTVRFVRSAIKK